eukprot:7828448-Alexandrium_andersonii.AAC.1
MCIRDRQRRPDQPSRSVQSQTLRVRMRFLPSYPVSQPAVSSAPSAENHLQRQPLLLNTISLFWRGRTPWWRTETLRQETIRDAGRAPPHCVVGLRSGCRAKRRRRPL